MAANEDCDPKVKYRMCECCKRTHKTIRKLDSGFKIHICPLCDLNQPLIAKVKKEG